MSLPDHIAARIDAWMGSADEPALQALEETLRGDEFASLDGDLPARLSRIRQALSPPPAIERLSDPDAALDEADWDEIAAVLAPEVATLPERPPPIARSPARRRVMLGLLAAAATATMFAWPRQEPLVLVTPAEAALPSLAPVLRGQPEGSAGPHITLTSPAAGQTHRSPFPFRLRLEPGADGVAVDPGSLQITYLRGAGVDVTRRLAAHAADGRLDVSVTVPAGTHAFEIYAADIELHPARLWFEVTVE
ncbi:MAG: hypothetical protein ACI8S6_004137 [Myxococcota bacterium]